ncbi:hypothetical protein JKF63_04624 [Porcisia hertigi]|uniref:Uncharacterized protein n=1 Tax=Porcisia hertigi TaxID=2761500 RepID=A0A836I4M8_9TRYP|nr:hypothetical protein JKF63_04624 [Porcisia hertigi]
MAKRLPGDRISKDMDGNNPWPSTFGGLERERTEEVVFSATALMELVAAFARTAAELALPIADGFSGHSHEETVPQMQPPAHARLHGSVDSCYGGDAVSGSEEYLGGFVENVVSGACTALDAVRCTGHLCAYAKTRVGSRNRDAASCGSGGHSAPAMVFTATHDEGQGQLRSLYNRLSFSQTAFQSVLCCERESWSKALQLTERMSEWNTSLDGLLGVSSLATSTSSTCSQLDALSPPRLLAVDGRDATIPLGATCPKAAAHLRGLSRSTAYMLLYVLAQHGRLAEVLRLCETIFSTNAFDLLRGWSTFDKHGADADAGLALILHLAVANTDPAAAGASALSAASVDLDLEARVHTALLDRMRCIECVVRAGVMPQRMLSVTEYATLVRRLLGDQVRSDAACHEFAATTMRRASPSSSLGWWLSPSQVWRLSAGLEHHVRTTLCLMGFQVNVRHGQTDMLNLEDLYVVLTITRQLVRRHDIDLRQLRDRQAKSLGGSGGGDGGDADGALSKPQSRRWVDWGVVTGNTKWTPLNSSSPPSELLSHPPPPTVTGTCAEVGAVSGCWTDLKARAPAKVALHGREELLLHLLPARRLAGSPTGADYVYQLCTTSHAACHRALLSFPPAYVEKSGFTAQHITPMPRQIPGVGAVNRGAASSTVAGSAVLLSLVSQETLSLLRAVCYTRNITLFWSSALGALAAQQLSVQASAAGAAGTLHGDGGFSERTAFASSATRVRENWLQPEEGSESLREEVAYALAHQAEVAVGASLVATRRLVDPLIVLAPYLSAYTVSALVQRPFRRAFTWQQCLALLPYTPLGSRSQLWLVRRIAQDNKGRRGAFPDVAAAPVSGASPAPGPRTLLTLSALSITTLETAEKMVAVEAAHQRHQRHQCSSERAGPNATLDAAQAAQRRRLVASPSSAESSASVFADAMAHADGALLALLLEGNWKRALQAFQEAPSRVQVGGAPHVVRLLVAADVWRDLSDAQRRPLVRLAVQGSAHSLGGVSGLLEEVLQTTLEHGLWHTGLYFHRSVAVEQPELVRQCRRAQCYAAQLCQGLLRRTSMTKTVAQMTKAVRRSQWAEAAACFLRYATQQRDGTPVVSTSLPPVHPLSDTPTGAPLEDAAALHTAPVCAASEKAAPPHAACTTAVPPTTSEELHSLAALIDADESVALQPHTRARASSSSPAFNLLCNSGDALIPLELAHVAQTARYAMLHTPLLWVRALQWLPKTALPLPFSHEQAWRVLCADNTEKLRAVLPPAVQLEASLDERGGASAQVAAAAAAAAVAAATVEDTVAMVTSTTEAALSLVEAARRAHRPQHANEVGKEQQAAVANALRVLHRAGAWEQAALLYDKAVESHCMPYASSSKVLEAAQQGGAPWQVTLTYFFRMSQRQRPDVNATAVALQACVEGGQWETAFRVLRQSVLTQAAPVPRLVMLAVNTALQCGVWSRALAAAHQYRRTRNPQLAHTVLLTYVRTQHWDDATEYFYDCTRRGLRPLDASLELAIIASEAASAEYRKTALMVGAIASALEDLYRMSGAVLEHIIFVHRQAQRGALHWQTVSSSPCCMPKRALHGAADIDHDGDFVLPHPAAASSRDEAHHTDADDNCDTV